MPDKFTAIVEWTRESQTPRTNISEEWYTTIDGKEIRLTRRVNSDLWFVHSSIGNTSFREPDRVIAGQEAFYRIHRQASNTCQAFKEAFDRSQG